MVANAPPAETLDPETEELWRAVIDFVMSAKTWWVSICAELDLTPAQGHALRSLDPERPVPMSTLADALLCDASNVTGIVDKLESRGLICRQSSEQDRRVKQLLVTPSGVRLRSKLMARMFEPPPAVNELPTDAKRQITSLLRAALAHRAR